MQSHDEVFAARISPSREPAFGALEAALARVFEPDWHPHLGERLTVFPRCIEIQVLTPEGAREELRCWPDFATFLEDTDAREMAYYPMQPSAWWVRVAHEETNHALHTFLCHDAEAVACGEWRSASA